MILRVLFRQMTIRSEKVDTFGVSGCPDKRKDSLTNAVNESFNGGDGIRTHDLLNAIQDECNSNLLGNQGHTSNAPLTCTNACTNESKTPLFVEELAAEIARLSNEDKNRLIALLVSGGSNS